MLGGLVAFGVGVGTARRPGRPGVSAMSVTKGVRRLRGHSRRARDSRRSTPRTCAQRSVRAYKNVIPSTFSTSASDSSTGSRFVDSTPVRVLALVTMSGPSSWPRHATALRASLTISSAWAVASAGQRVRHLLGQTCARAGRSQMAITQAWCGLCRWGSRCWRSLERGNAEDGGGAGDSAVSDAHQGVEGTAGDGSGDGGGSGFHDAGGSAGGCGPCRCVGQWLAS
jgi:hypothetical protein